MTDVSKSGFTAIFVDAAAMRKGDMPFAVVLDDNEVKCYGVSKENWKAIEENYEIYVKAGSCKPLVYIGEGFKDTARQMGWVIVGDV